MDKCDYTHKQNLNINEDRLRDTGYNFIKDL